MLHNVIHLLLGALGIARSRFSSSARRSLQIAGGLAAVLWLFGLLVDQGSMSNFVPLNAVNTWAYLVISVVLIGLSFLSGEVTRSSRATPRPASAPGFRSPARRDVAMCRYSPRYRHIATSRWPLGHRGHLLRHRDARLAGEGPQEPLTCDSVEGRRGLRKVRS